MHQLIRITSSYYVAGIEVNESGYIVNCPPILKWAAGKTIEPVIAYFHRKQFKVEYLNGDEE